MEPIMMGPCCARTPFFLYHVSAHYYSTLPACDHSRVPANSSTPMHHGEIVYGVLAAERLTGVFCICFRARAHGRLFPNPASTISSLWQSVVVMYGAEAWSLVVQHI